MEMLKTSVGLIFAGVGVGLLIIIRLDRDANDKEYIFTQASIWFIGGLIILFAQEAMSWTKRECTNCQTKTSFDTSQWTERKQLGLCPLCFENYLRDLQRQYSEHPDRYAERLDEVSWETQRYNEFPLSGREDE